MLTAAAIVSIFASYTLHSEPLDQAIGVETATTEAAVKSQNKIDALSDTTRQMLEQYRSATHQTKSLRTYNEHLKRLLTSQEEEKK